jgi:hypothetical protein
LAVIQDAVENLTKSFEGLAEFMKEECNLSIKAVTRYPVARNSRTTLGTRAK